MLAQQAQRKGHDAALPLPPRTLCALRPDKGLRIVRYHAVSCNGMLLCIPCMWHDVGAGTHVSIVDASIMTCAQPHGAPAIHNDWH